MASGKRSYKEIKSDRVIYNVMLSFLGYMGLLFLYLLLNLNTYKTWQAIVAVLWGISIAGFIVSCIWRYVVKKRNIDESPKAFPSTSVMGLTASAAIVMTVLWAYEIVSFKYLFVLVPAAIVLYFVYSIFKADYSIFATLTLATGLGLWAFGKLQDNIYADGTRLLIMIGVIALAALSAALLAVLSRRRGSVKFAGKTYQVLPAEIGGAYVYILCALSAVLVVISYLTTGRYTSYCLAALGIYVLLTTIYYMYKLSAK